MGTHVTTVRPCCTLSLCAGKRSLDLNSFFGTIENSLLMKLALIGIA